LISNSLPNKYTIFFRGNFSHLSDADTVPDHNIAILHGISRAMQVYFNTMQSSCKLGHIGRAGLLVIVLVYFTIMVPNYTVNQNQAVFTCVFTYVQLYILLPYNITLNSF
jgi:hypothetical protein